MSRSSPGSRATSLRRSSCPRSRTTRAREANDGTRQRAQRARLRERGPSPGREGGVAGGHSAPTMSRRAEFVEFVLERLAPIGGARARAMFGGHGIYNGATMFAIVVDDSLYFKADDLTRPAFAA